MQQFDGRALQFQLTPLVRYYRQTSAEFYTLERFPSGDYYSSDARLSAYGAITLGLDSRARWRAWTISLDFQYYLADENFSVIQRTGDETPSLLSYTVLSLGAEYRY